jgi:hypothetical protein
MQNLNNRQLSILITLLNNDEPVSAQQPETIWAYLLEL